jgi:hypothetical protein
MLTPERIIELLQLQPLPVAPHLTVVTLPLPLPVVVSA